MLLDERHVLAAPAKGITTTSGTRPATLALRVGPSRRLVLCAAACSRPHEPIERVWPAAARMHRRQIRGGGGGRLWLAQAFRRE
jgi:hypothetical protein